MPFGGVLHDKYASYCSVLGAEDVVLLLLTMFSRFLRRTASRCSHPVSTHIHAHIRAHTYTRTHTHTYTRSRPYFHIHTYVHTFALILTHTHTPTCLVYPLMCLVCQNGWNRASRFYWTASARVQVNHVWATGVFLATVTAGLAATHYASPPAQAEEQKKPEPQPEGEPKKTKQVEFRYVRFGDGDGFVEDSCFVSCRFPFYFLPGIPHTDSVLFLF